MPRKLRQLIADLERAGFIRLAGKGSHRKFTRGTTTVIIAGQPGDDAKSYQERDVAKAIESQP
ncbi:MAG: type II toxin-antitoxin system HicA family toxin [Planctomycetes bacterium]|nr:type II toxin-antitoxin system HicA family toxin [Planctomycetota bacterium]